MVHPIGCMLVCHIIRLQAGLILLRWRAWVGWRERVLGSGSLAAGVGVGYSLAKLCLVFGSRRICRGGVKWLR